MKLSLSARMVKVPSKKSATNDSQFFTSLLLLHYRPSIFVSMFFPSSIFNKTSVIVDFIKCITHHLFFGQESFEFQQLCSPLFLFCKCVCIYYYIYRYMIFMMLVSSLSLVKLKACGCLHSA